VTFIVSGLRVEIEVCLGSKPTSLRLKALRFSPYLYRARNLVERFFNNTKHCRRVAIRYDKFSANYLAFVQLASTRLWLVLMSPRPNSRNWSLNRLVGFGCADVIGLDA
jgi:hypothetical protein